MQVRHIGPVTGTGRFALEPIDSEGTRIIWEEQLVFPWRLGGPVGERVAAPILRRLFAANLETFAQLVEQRNARAS